MTETTWLPHLPFASTREQRVAHARERFFEEGARPTGLVDEAVLQSWQRCRGQGRERAERITIEPVSRLRLDTALRRSRLLREAASSQLQQLERSLAATDCTILLVDPQGTIIYASNRSSTTDSALMPSLARPGVDVSERALGTNAPGIVLATGRACTIDAGEHYFDQIRGMRCAAAPIRDIHGRLAGVLDLTVEQRAFGFDPGVLASLHAQAMQRGLMQAQSAQHTLVEMHLQPHALGDGSSGLMGLDEAGEVVWLDPFAERLCGAVARVAGESLPCEAVLGVRLGLLHQWGLRGDVHPLALPNGLGVWMRVRLPLSHRSPPDSDTCMALDAARPVTHAEPIAAVTPSLADHGRALIAQTLQDCQGNVSEAARRLGISRGRIYRTMSVDTSQPVHAPEPSAAGESNCAQSGLADC